MSSINDWLSVESIDLTMRAESELETIAATLDLAGRSAEVKDIKQLAEELLLHEVMTPSLTGGCAVVFHALSSAVLAPKIFFGRFDKGIGYYSKQGRPIDLIFLVIAPLEKEEEYNEMLKTMKQALQDVSLRERLRSAQSPEEALTVLLKYAVRE